MQSSQNDQEALIQEDMAGIAKMGEHAKEIFSAMDTDNSSLIGLEEFYEALEDKRMKAFFNAMKLDISEVDTLFMPTTFSWTTRSASTSPPTCGTSSDRPRRRRRSARPPSRCKAAGAGGFWDPAARTNTFCKEIANGRLAMREIIGVFSACRP
jgi:hypothetical protein